MKALINPTGQCGRVLLLTLLLLAQGAALAHEIDHLGFPNSETCVTCSAHTGSDAIGTAAVPAFYPPGALRFQASACPHNNLYLRASTHSARAPPAVL